MPSFKHTLIGIGSICDADSYQGDENLLAQNGGIFLYAQIQQKFLCYLLTLKEHPCRFSVSTTSQVWRLWYSTSTQKQYSWWKTIGSVLLKMVTNILVQESPIPMLLNFVHHWTKVSCEILFIIDMVWNQQNPSWITNHIVTQFQHPKNPGHSQRNCMYASSTPVNSTQKTLGY